MSIDLWLAFAAASALLVLIPGPTVLLVLSYALSRGRKVAVATALGVATGDLIAMTATLVGLGALILASATAFMVLKWLGAAYLVWLGVKMLRSASRATFADPSGRANSPPRAVFGHAALVTALNPKSIGFFIAFVPQFIQHDAPLASQFTVMIATFVGIGGLNALAYALLAGSLRNRLSRPGVIRGLTRIGGATLIAMGALTATLKRA